MPWRVSRLSRNRSTAASLLLLLLALSSTACKSGDPVRLAEEASPLTKTQQELEARQGSQQADGRPVLQICESAPLPRRQIDDGDWNRTRSRIAATLMSPRHVVADILSTGKSDVTIAGKFGHGPVVKDLEREKVEIYYDDCSGSFQKVGIAETDGEGWLSFRWRREQLPDYGMYQLYFRVAADGSDAVSTMRILPQGTKIAIFDIDGTLTTSDHELWKDWAADAGRFARVDDYVPKLRSGASAVTRHRAWQQGYIPVYLTGRFYWMYYRTRSWMAATGVAPGHLEMAPGWSEWLPFNGGVGTFKAEYIESLRDQGFEISIMYGNATTDVWAYEFNFTGSEQIFLFDNTSDLDEAENIDSSYLNHLYQLERDEKEPITQPFVYPVLSGGHEPN